MNAHPEWLKGAVSRLFAEAEYLHHRRSSTESGPAVISVGPVVNVSWFAAKAYCASHGFRLPTADEWEYVASRPIPGDEVRNFHYSGR